MSEEKPATWRMTDLEAGAFDVLKTRLGFTIAEFCEFAGFNKSSFSQILSGRRNFNPSIRQRLDVFLTEKLQDHSGVSDDQRQEILSSMDAILRRGSENNLKNHVYQPPGPLLPVGAPNYIERYADILIQKALSDHSRMPSEHSMVKAAYVVGGVGTGKKSLLKRIPAIALNMGRQPVVGKTVNFFVDGEWPSTKLSKGQVWNACGFALSDGHDEFRTNNLDPEKRSFNREFRRLINRHLKKKPRAIRIVEDFYQLSLHAENLEYVYDLLHTLFDRSLRKDDNLIIIADEALAGSIEGVSEYVTRGAFIDCAHIDPASLNELVMSTIGDHPSGKLLENISEPAESMRDAFGCCMFLHHAALHKIRQIPEERFTHYTTVAVLDEVIDEILNALEDGQNVDQERDDLADRLEQFSKSILHRLEILERSEGARTIRMELADGILSSGASLRVKRYLEWNGYIEKGGGVPDFVQRICQRGVQ